MTPHWKDVIKSALGDMLNTLVEKQSGICKFYFGEEFHGILADDIANFINYAMNELSKQTDDFPFRGKITNDNDRAALLIWYEKNQPVDDGYDGEDPHYADCSFYNDKKCNCGAFNDDEVE